MLGIFGKALGIGLDWGIEYSIGEAAAPLVAPGAAVAVLEELGRVKPKVSFSISESINKCFDLRERPKSVYFIDEVEYILKLTSASLVKESLRTVLLWGGHTHLQTFGTCRCYLTVLEKSSRPGKHWSQYSNGDVCAKDSQSQRTLCGICTDRRAP